jgi:hypothetical protein
MEQKAVMSPLRRLGPSDEVLVGSPHGGVRLQRLRLWTRQAGRDRQLIY